MRHLFQKHKEHWLDKSFLISSFIGAALLAGSLFINYYVGVYATKQASNAVTDILLSNIPTFDVDFFVVGGAFIFVGFITALCIYEPKYIPFILKSVALFIVVRAIFVSMTHIGPYPDREIINTNKVVDKFVVGGELFFSGHTGLPFLFAMAFWPNKILRGTFIALTLIAATTVILGHVHYTIDVFSAPFISYGIFHIGRKIFNKDYKLFSSGL